MGGKSNRTPSALKSYVERGNNKTKTGHEADNSSEIIIENFDLLLTSKSLSKCAQNKIFNDAYFVKFTEYFLNQLLNF